MAWQDEAIPLVRALINDYDDPLTYLDSKLEDYFVFAAHLLKSLPFQNTYTISMSEGTITPDPSSDYAFINLVSLQTACLIYKSEVKTYINESVAVADGFGGRTSIDTKSRAQYGLESLDKCMKALEKAKVEHMMGEGLVGQAIMTPRTLEYYWIN